MGKIDMSKIIHIQLDYMEVWSGQHWFCSPCKCNQNGASVFLSKARHLHTKWLFSETSGQVILPQKQLLIN